jgi:hypothetical protein
VEEVKIEVICTWGAAFTIDVRCGWFGPAKKVDGRTASETLAAAHVQLIFVPGMIDMQLPLP